MNIRDEKQKEAADIIIKCRSGIINAAPRFGKIKTVLDAFKEIKPKKVLVVYPTNDIKSSWENEVLLRGAVVNIDYVSTVSLKKKIECSYDYIVADEIHDYSIKELKNLSLIRKKGGELIGLSGTMTNKSINKINNILRLHVVYRYSIEEAIEDGVLCDYILNVHQVSLDKEEQWRFNKYNYVRLKLLKEEKPTFNIDLKIISFLQKSEAKRKKTIELIELFKEKRVLVFTGLSIIADSLGIPSYHSKNKNKELFDAFCKGDGNHLATVRMADAGVTIKPINIGILNYFSGSPENTTQKICRFLGAEWENPNKIAEIHIITTYNDFEMERLKTALMFLDSEKIKYFKD